MPASKPTPAPAQKPSIPALDLGEIRGRATKVIAEGVDFIIRPPSPRTEEGYGEQGLQKFKEKVGAPVTQAVKSEIQKASQAKQDFEACKGSTQGCLAQADLPRLAEGYVLEGVRTLSQATGEVREGINTLSQLHQLAAEQGLIPNIPDPVRVGAGVLEGAHLAVEALPNVVRRTCQQMGVNPAYCQDAGDFTTLLLIAGGLGNIKRTEQAASLIETALEGRAAENGIQRAGNLSHIAHPPMKTNVNTVPALSLEAPQGVPNTGGFIKSFVTKSGEYYYRVYSGTSEGGFLTKAPPKSRALAREGLALPPEHKATYIQKVWVPAGTRLQRSRVFPAYDKRGGMEQYFLIDKIPDVNFKQGTLFK